MATEYPLINVSQLDLDALSSYITSKNKLVYRSDAASDKASDTDYVAEVPAANIAKAFSSDTDSDYLWHQYFANENLKITLKDRNTVQNSMRLGGRSAADYMTQEDGDSLATIQNNFISTYLEEIKDLKDEVYQLRHELQKNRTIEGHGYYNGFSDEFKNTEYVNIQDAVGTIEGQDYSGKTTITFTTSQQAIYDAFDVYDYICLVTPSNYYCIRQITAKSDLVFTLNKTIAFTYAGAGSSETGNTSTSTLALYKSKGIIHNGMYKFATDSEKQPGSLYYNGLTDDRKITNITIDTEGKGYAYSFRIIGENSNENNNDSYISQQGYLQSIKLLAVPVGNPGNLICYVIDKADMSKFKNPTQFAEDYANQTVFGTGTNTSTIRFFAKSSAKWAKYNNKQYITFDFEDEGSYPLMSRDDDYDDEKVEYVMILTATDVNAATSSTTANSYNIICLQKNDSSGSDLETNFTLYNYTEIETNSTQANAFTDVDSDDRDLFFQIVTREVVENEPETLPYGLYTAHYHNQNLKSGSHGEVARLTLRIKREGRFYADTQADDPVVYSKEKVLPVAEDTGCEFAKVSDLNLERTSFYKDVQERTSDGETTQSVPVVIGNNITTVSSTDSNGTQTVTSTKYILVDEGDKVYRVGYNVVIKARKITFNKDNGTYTIPDTYDRFILPLTDVAKDVSSDTNEYSDKLIFEKVLAVEKTATAQDVANGLADAVGDTYTEFNEYNDFEIQLYWENTYLDTIANYSTDQSVRKEAMGAIRDLVLTIDKNFVH